MLRIVDRAGEQRRAYRGRATIHAFGESHTQRWPYRHCVAHPRLKIDGDRAHVRSGYVLIAGYTPEPTVAAWGNYDDQLVREEDGRWRFAERAIVAFQSHPQLPTSFADRH